MWRAMNSLIVLRDEVDLIAPNRSRASDGLVGDAAHQATNSDHNPHYVAGVGSEIVTALDLTHDPAHGFDSYLFAETLRLNRDRRLKYVISNRRIFSSYASGTRPAWTWGSYGGTDPHTNHVHTSVLDAVISDTRAPWNLEGFEADMTPAQQYTQHVINYRTDAILHMRPIVSVPAFVATDGSRYAAFSEKNDQAAAILALSAGGGDVATAAILQRIDERAAEETARDAAHEAEVHDLRNQVGALQTKLAQAAAAEAAALGS